MYKTAVEEAGQSADPDPDCADPDPAELPPTKNERYDNNWRSAKGIVARDKKVEIVFFQRNSLAKSNVSLSKSVSEKKSNVKKLENEEYVNAKSSQTASPEKEVQHKRAIALLCENHTCDTEAAFAVADEEKNNNLETEKLRLISEKEYSTNLRTERQRSSGKLKKELAIQKAVNEYSHKHWMQNLKVYYCQQVHRNCFEIHHDSLVRLP